MNIGIDIDDTISDTYESMFNYAQKYTIEDLKRSGKINKNEKLYTHMYCTSLHNWTDEEDREFFNKYYEAILNEVKPKKYSVEVINKLKEEKNNIYIITARFNSDKFNVEETTKKWLEKYNIKYDKLFLNIENKAEIAKENNLDIFIDDSFKNCKEILDCGIKTYILDTRINENLEYDKLERVYSWIHLYQEIEKYMKKRRNA